MPHFHPDEWRTGVVLSGNYHFGLGEQWDESKLTPYRRQDFPGAVEATFLRGRKIYERGRFASAPSGAILKP